MDSLLIKERVVNGHSVCIAVVCDGVGSTKDGSYASAITIKMISDWFEQITTTNRIGLLLRDYILRINEYIAQQAQERNLKTATTLSALLISNGRYYIANVGDSRIYGFKNQTLKLLTQDQSSNGKLTFWLGRPKWTEVFYNEGICEEQHFLICSDGLYKKMDNEYLQLELLKTNGKTLNQTIEHLVNHVVERGETDNISLAMVSCES